MTQPQEVQQNIQETNEINVQENQTNGTVSPIISEQEQEKILRNFEEYEKILIQLKEQKKKEKEMMIRKRIEEKESEIQNLEKQIEKEKNERDTLIEELEEIIGTTKIIITPEKRIIEQQNNLYPENGNDQEWREFKNGNQQESNNKWEGIPQTPRKTVQFQQNNGINQRKKNMCSNCNIEGHYFQNCPYIECSLCKKKGHIGRFCPERMCQICNQKGHIERDCNQNYNNQRRIQNDIGKEFSFGEKFERNGNGY